MSERDDQTTPDTPIGREQSVSNPFNARDEGEERPPINLSKKRAAAMGTAVGLIMTLLALVCIAVAFALSNWTA